MTREELVKAGLSESLADSIVKLEERAETADSKIKDLQGSVSALETANTRLEESNTKLEAANTKLEEANTKLQKDVDTHAAALETSETARAKMERDTAQKEAEAESASYKPLTVSAEACLAIRALDEDKATAIREALGQARDELKVVQGELGTPTGETPEDSGTGTASALTNFVKEQMAKGMTRVEALATDEAKRLAQQERAANVRRAAAERV